ncbi:phenylpyruvate tautomerase PptA (4-oxalocrotonate tautomerase family) [Antricoccus suffuscus]|uniref:Phenylpyruvate tautomerase PptA (4-oxalocrotonate tautomerase family) n=1 Tax=Antricoccus suffuscus TaxID=1629062 RepID=A0A2T1A6T7_9ACTN|nr:tautomerase family protein [Antricoccus suffuscus]PRZ44311.1 phenylpyruvate tautomerase PptA (4-oxalocrotonate tautomerase family) [Antricoccus suffuscus]
MPFYTCYTSEDALSADQRAHIAEAITRIHVGHTGAPRGFVRVLFQESAKGDCYTAGEVADFGMIRGVIRAGRSAQTKEALLRDLWELLQTVTGLGDHELLVSVQENPASNAMEGGEVLPEPGQEAQWMARH